MCSHTQNHTCVRTQMHMHARCARTHTHTHTHTHPHTHKNTKTQTTKDNKHTHTHAVASRHHPPTPSLIDSFWARKKEKKKFSRVQTGLFTFIFFHTIFS